MLGRVVVLTGFVTGKGSFKNRFRIFSCRENLSSAGREYGVYFYFVAVIFSFCVEVSNCRFILGSGEVVLKLFKCGFFLGLRNFNYLGKDKETKVYLFFILKVRYEVGGEKFNLEIVLRGRSRCFFLESI